MARLLRFAITLCVLFSLVAIASAATRVGPSEVLPLRRLRLYETGVGYFERSGPISAQTRLPRPAA